MKFYCYILFSELRKKYYIGFTRNSIEERIKKHNTNHSGFTGRTADWKLVHLESFASETDAKNREKYIKIQKSRKFIEKLIAGSGNPDL